MEPIAGQLPRSPLGLVTIGNSDPQLLAERTVAPTLRLTGFVMLSGGPGGPAPLSGTLVQVFCMGAADDCVAKGGGTTEGVQPLYEAFTRPDGGYELLLPDPGH